MVVICSVNVVVILEMIVEWIFGRWLKYFLIFVVKNIDFNMVSLIGLSWFNFFFYNENRFGSFVLKLFLYIFNLGSINYSILINCIC